MMASAHAQQPALDMRRLSAAHLCLQVLPVFERHSRGDFRPRAAVVTALDYGNGRLDVMADHNALERCRQWADEAAHETNHPKAEAAALAVAAACERTIDIEAVRRLVNVALN